MIDLTKPIGHCAFLFLQVILAPILYPYGFILQAVFLLGTALYHNTLQERECYQLVPLLVVFVLSGAVDEDISFAGHTVRWVGAALIAFYTTPLKVLSAHLMDPEVAILLAVECLAAPHLHSFGYLAQLVLFHCLAWRQALDKAAVKIPHPQTRTTVRDDPTQTIPICNICFDRSVDTAFGSCGHVCCRRCVDGLGSRQICPFCNTRSANHIHLHFP